MRTARNRSREPSDSWREKLLTTTRFGKLATRVSGGGLVVFAVFMVIASMNLGRGGGPKGTFFEDPLWAVLVVAAGTGFVAGGALGLAAVFKQHERAVLVWPTIAIGLVVAFFWLGEATTPH